MTKVTGATCSLFSIKGIAVGSYIGAPALPDEAKRSEAKRRDSDAVGLEIAKGKEGLRKYFLKF